MDEGRSVTDLLPTLQELEHLGVGFVSLTEALDLTTPARRAMAVVSLFSSSLKRKYCANSGWPGPCPAERETAWPTGHRSRPCGGNPETAVRRCQQIRDR